MAGRTDDDSTRGHTELDHPADRAIHLWAPSEADLLVEAGRAIVELLCGPGEVARAARRDLALTAVDAEDRLVRFMNEVLLLATVEGFLFADATITLRDDGLRATLVGEPDAAARIVAELKAATYHRLVLDRRPGRCTATVIVDV